MAAIISTTSLYSPPLSSSSHTSTSPFKFIHFPSYHCDQSSCRTPNTNYRHINLLFTCQSSSNHDSHNYAAEEQRWLREEQRWLREEQRWLREEARWNAERQSLLLQVQHLQSELDRVRARNSAKFDVDFVLEDSSASETLTKMAALLKGTVDSKSSVIEDNSKQIADISVKLEVDKPVNVDSVAAPASTEGASEVVKAEVKPKKSRASLRMGAEGEEVRALQEALMSLGFYSGEEDMEFASFSDGTVSAVKTWQASVGIREDGIMTAELLDRLYASQEAQGTESSAISDIGKIDEANGAVIEVREVQQTIVKKGPAEVDITENRVFLLGENRWEDRSRLNKGNGKQAVGGNTPVSTTKCPTCQGEGRLMCMECDGSGEPNVDEQFLEWMEGAKCPYCEGLGYTVCDVCKGRPIL